MNEDASCSSVTEQPSFRPFYFSSDFTQVVKSPGFVDKTSMLKELLNHELMVLITAPRRFGKSTNLDMIKKFMEIQVNCNGVRIDRETSTNRKIFEDNNLLIFQDEKFFNEHFAAYPVIHISFKSINGNSFDEILDMFRIVLHQTFQKCGYFVVSPAPCETYVAEFYRYFQMTYKELEIPEIVNGLAFLSSLLYMRFGKKVFVLIDEYDAPINNAMFNKDVDVNEVNKFLRMIFSHTLKENEYVERAVLTGNSNFASVTLCDVNYVEKCMFLDDHPFVPFYGLTEDELTQLFSKFKIDEYTKEKVTHYYGSYVSSRGVRMFSIWSILHFLKQQVIKNYWNDSGTIPNLREVMDIPVIRQCIEAFCLEKCVTIEILRKVTFGDIIMLRKICLQTEKSETKQLVKPDIFLNFIMEQGYLTYDKHVKDNSYAVKVPNAETIQEFRRLIRDYYHVKHVDLRQCSHLFNRISANASFGNFVAEFNKVLIKFNQNHIIANEDTYLCLISSILYETKFAISTAVTHSGARPHFILYSDHLGIIIELAYKTTSAQALQQILNRYLSCFEQPFFKDITKKLFLGININMQGKANVSLLVNSTDINDVICF